MINIRSILKLTDGDGLTLKDGKPTRYKSGWQVATEGIETTDTHEAMRAIKQYNGDCGIWFENGIYYIDKSHRENTKAKALQVGKEHNQISIYGWARGNLAYC